MSATTDDLLNLNAQYARAVRQCTTLLETLSFLEKGTGGVQTLLLELAEDRKDSSVKVVNALLSEYFSGEPVLRKDQSLHILDVMKRIK